MSAEYQIVPDAARHFPHRVIGNALLFNADCLSVLPTLEKVDAVITDPPYHGVKQDAWDNQWRTDADFLAWADSVMRALKGRMTFSGSLYWFASPQMAARIETLARQHFCVLNNLVWNKGGARKGAAGTGIDVTSLRSFWTANTERIIFAEQYGSDSAADGEAGYMSACEETKRKIFGDYFREEFARAGVTNGQVAALFPSRTGGLTGCVSNWLNGANVPTADQYESIRDFLNSCGGEFLKREYEDLKREYEDLKREYEDLKREYEDLRRPFNADAADQWGDVWEFPLERSQVHPTQKPEKLIAHIVKISSKSGGVVLDSFMGSGTTGVACANLGRKFIGIEINEKYFDIACKRIEAAYAQGRLFA